MTETKNKLGVALVKRACRLCASVYDGDIVMNTILSERRAAEVEKLHGQVVGYLDKPCDKCQELMKQGFLVIEVDEDKTDDVSNPYRTGRQYVIKHEFAVRILGEEGVKKGVAFITDKAWKQITGE